MRNEKTIYNSDEGQILGEIRNVLRYVKTEINMTLFPELWKVGQHNTLLLTTLQSYR